MTRPRDLERAGAYVAARRGELNLTQVELALTARIDAKTLYSLETGNRWPQASTRSAIEKALGWQQGDLAKIASGVGEPTPPLIRAASSGGQSGRSVMHASPGEVMTVRRIPSWLAAEAERNGMQADDLAQSVQQLHHLASRFRYNLAELLLNAGLASEAELHIKERPTPGVRDEALAEYDAGVNENVSAPLLTPRQQKKARADADRRREESIEKNH